MTVRERAIRCRAYPTTEQMEQITVSCDGSRHVWNKALEYYQSAYELGLKRPTTNALICLLPKLKAAKPWLEECESSALQQAIRNLGAAYAKAFDNVKKHKKVTRKKPRHRKPNKNIYGFPVYHSAKKHKRSYRITNGDRKRVVLLKNEYGNDYVKLPKLGLVKIRGLREFHGEITSVTVTYSRDDRYYVTLHINAENFRQIKTPVNDVVGVDVGVRSLAVTSNGEIFDNVHALKRHEKRLARLQHIASRKKKGSKSRAKVNKLIAREHAKIASIRRDRCDKVSLAIVSDNQAVVCETLGVKNMLYDHHGAKALSDASLSMLLFDIAYKCEWYDRDFHQVGRFYPSSKTCHECGFVNKDLKRSDDVWECPGCHTVLHRDFNAALNLRDEGVRYFNRVGLTRFKAVGDYGKTCDLVHRELP